MNMIKKLLFVLLFTTQILSVKNANAQDAGFTERQFYVKTLTKIADPE
jgi:hypothetical protein